MKCATFAHVMVGRLRNGFAYAYFWVSVHKMSHSSFLEAPAVLANLPHFLPNLPNVCQNLRFKIKFPFEIS